MTHTPSPHAQHPAPSDAPQRRAWKTPVLDVLPLAEAESSHWQASDGHGHHRSS
jgi:hypothetical protein